MFKHMSLRIKLLATFTLLALFLGAVGLLNFKGIKQVFETFDHIAEVNLPNASTLGDMRFAISEIDRDILNLALADSSKEIQGKLIADYKQAVADYEKSSKIYEGIPFVPGEAERYDKVSAAFKDYLESTRRYVELSRSSASRSSSLLFDNYQTDIAPKRQLLDTSIHELINFQNSQAETKGDEADKVAYFYTQLSIWLVAAGFLAAIGLGALISWSLSKTLNNIAEITVQSTNEVNLATSQLSAASHGLSGASTQVASSLQETAASIEELNAMVKQSAENANEAATSSNQGRDLAAKMDADMKTLLDSLLEMSEKSKQIGEIVTLIDDMAFQTNILALNASVEAARAGDAGKGFAVVADAVRSLAQKSASSSKSIATLIHASLESVTKSTRIAEDSHRSLSAIVEVVRKIAKLNDELAASSREQSQALSQITKAMSEIDQATQQNAAASEQIAASSEEMSAQAESMMGVVQTLNIIVRGLAESRSVLH